MSLHYKNYTLFHIISVLFAEEFTAASIDCDNVRLNWISSDDFEAVEARLFVSCQSINDSEVIKEMFIFN